MVSAKLSYLRISPRKARLVADLVRGKSVEKAQSILSFTIKRAASPILKLLNSAVANAKNNFHLDAKGLYVARIWVNEGAVYKRVMPRARGNANQLRKRTCHVELVHEWQRLIFDVFGTTIDKGSVDTRIDKSFVFEVNSTVTARYPTARYYQVVVSILPDAKHGIC